MPNFLQQQKKLETIAAIDLGSNALRAIIARKSGQELKTLKNFRIPLRLGEDVFQLGLISRPKMIKTEEAFIKLLHIFTEYNVTQIKAFATSAMRDSRNGKILASKIFSFTGIDIETISGIQEAETIFYAVKNQINLKKKKALIMDIGGGSTELIITQGEKIIGIESFDIGTIRLLDYHETEIESKILKNLNQMEMFIQQYIKVKDLDFFIGTGGNLRRIGKIRKKMLKKESSEFSLISEISHMKETIVSMSYVDRIRQLELDKNRADVILPAIMLTYHLMKKLNFSTIHLPRVGLKEGILLSMLDEKSLS